MRIFKINIILCVMTVAVSCADSGFKGSTGKPQPVVDPNAGPANQPAGNLGDSPTPTGGGGTPVVSGPVEICTEPFDVSAKSNPFFAGNIAGTSLRYNFNGPKVDEISVVSPVLAATSALNCFKPGYKLVFNISGTISHGGGGQTTDGDGQLTYVVSHDKGAVFGKSNFNLPINSFIGVFLDDADPSALPSPAARSYATQPERDFATQSPELRQIFYIGDGKTSAGVQQVTIVPPGATRLYFAIADIGQWNNNSGALKGQILWNP